MEKLIFILPLLFNFSLFAQNGPVNPLSTRSHGVANASVAFSDINSLFNNQAGLADLETISLLLSAQETFVGPYSDNFGAGFAMPTSSGTFGLNIHYFGSNDINQIKVGLAYARKLMERLSLGVQFDFLSTQISPYDRSKLFSNRIRVFTFEVGLQYKLIENLIIGIHLYNPAKLEIIENEFLPRILRMGATYSVNDKILIHGELQKDFDFPIIFKSGIEYELINDLWFRIGCQVKPTTFNLGLGYQFKNGFRFDLATYYQAGLNLTSSGILGSSGLVPTFGLGFDFF